jgi:peroxiredoxin
MVEYNKIYEQFKESGFVLLAISTDTEKSVAKVKPYIKSKDYKFPVLLDTNSEVCKKILCAANAIHGSLLIKAETLYTLTLVI